MVTLISTFRFEFLEQTLREYHDRHTHTHTPTHLHTQWESYGEEVVYLQTDAPP